MATSIGIANGIGFEKKKSTGSDINFPDWFRDVAICYFDVGRQKATNESLQKEPVLKDFMGNTNGLVLSGFSFTPESGIESPGKLVFDGIDDYGEFNVPSREVLYYVLYKVDLLVLEKDTWQYLYNVNNVRNYLAYTSKFSTPTPNTLVSNGTLLSPRGNIQRVQHRGDSFMDFCTIGCRSNLIEYANIAFYGAIFLRGLVTQDELEYCIKLLNGEV